MQTKRTVFFCMVQLFGVNIIKLKAGGKGLFGN